MSPSRSSLTRRRRPKFEAGALPFRVVDLFAGCGGLTLGLAQAALEQGRALDVRLAVDFEPMATAVYRENFPLARRVETGPVEEYFDGDLGAVLSLGERVVRAHVGALDALMGGPPCQGHSNLNNHTRRVDEKNALYHRMARAAEVLRPRLVVIENVPSVLRDRHDGEGVVTRVERHLQGLGYRTAQRIVSLAELGVAQTRKRHILIAAAENEPDPAAILAHVVESQIERDLAWAIGDLVNAPEIGLLDQRPRPTQVNLARMRFLLDHDIYDLPNELRPRCQQDAHKYRSMYGRLRWDRPAQTVTSGYGSIGQGRYMHPDQPRALTAHEAARIQGFPDYFDFSAATSRLALATMIGNAVPPPLGRAIVGSYLALAPSAEASLDREAAETA
jgi:DNA (cytosine-5)-methyltransferase 1